MKENGNSNSKKPSQITSYITPKDKIQEIPHRPTKISEFLKAKKNANFEIDLSSLSKKTFASLINKEQKFQNQSKKKEEEKKVSIISD